MTVSILHDIIAIFQSGINGIGGKRSRPYMLVGIIKIVSGQVNAREAGGIYTVTVTGEKAKGSIRFMVENN